MQGRLLPKYIGRYQAHPVGYWQDEFSIASKLGLKYIEFIFDYNDAKSNPLLSDSGLQTIIDISNYFAGGEYLFLGTNANQSNVPNQYLCLFSSQPLF